MLITSSDRTSKNKSWKSSQSRNKLKQVREPDSKPTLLLEIKGTILDLDGNVTKKFKELLKVPSLWLNSILFQ